MNAAAHVAVNAADRCPICGKVNACAMEIERATGEKQPPCWCTRIDFTADLLSRVPKAMQGAACICAECARSADLAKRAQD